MRTRRGFVQPNPLYDYGWGQQGLQAPTRRQRPLSYADPFAGAITLDPLSAGLGQPVDPFGVDPNNPFAISAAPRMSMPRASATDKVTLTPEDEKSLLSSVISTGGSALQKAGTFLDTPGSVVRGLLAGEPKRALGGIFDPEQRVQAEDLTGLKSTENDDWLTKTGNFAANMGVSVLTDPLSWLGGGILGATSRTGNALKAAGLLDKSSALRGLLGAEAKAGAEGLAGGIGRRLSMMRNTGADVLARYPASKLERAAMGSLGRGLPLRSEAMEKLGNYATKSLGGADVGELLQRPLGGNLNLGLFGGGRKPWATFNVPGGETVAKGMDTLGDWVRFGKMRVPFTNLEANPIPLATSLLNSSMHGLSDVPSQRLMPLLNANIAYGEQAGREAGGVYSWLARKYGLDTDEGQRAVSALAEAKGPEAIQAAKDALAANLGVPPTDVDALHDMIAAGRADPRNAAVAVGVGSREWSDKYSDYFPRNIVPNAYPKEAIRGGNRGLDFGVLGSKKMARSPETRNIIGGVNTLRDFWSNPDLAAIADQIKTGVPGMTPKDLATKIGKLFGDRIPATYYNSRDLKKLAGAAERAGVPLEDFVGNPRNLAGVKVTPCNTYNRLAKTFLNTPKEARSLGLYNVDPAFSLEQMVRAPLTHAARAEFLAQRLAMPNVLTSATGGRPITDFTKRLGLKWGNETEGFGKAMLEARGEPVTAENLKTLKFLTVVPSLAKSLTAATSFGVQPESVGKLLGGIDSATNLFKSAMTAFPAFVARNVGGMAVKSWHTDQGTLGSTLDAMRMLVGKPVESLATDPSVLNLAAKLKAAGFSIDPKRLTPQEATDLYSTVLHGADTLSGWNMASTTSSGKMTPGAPPPIVPKTLADYTANFPGQLSGANRTYGTPFSIGDFFKKLIGKKNAAGKGTTWNPFKGTARGVRGATESTYAPFAATQYANSFAEDQSRLADVMRLTTQGYDPAVAADMMKTAKFRYDPGSFTPFEKNVMKRVVPFWAYTKQATADTIRELAGNPGGKLGQIIKATGAMSDTDNMMLPDYVKQTFAMPIPEGFPLVGPEPGGEPRYLTGFGLMHEQDPFGFLGAGARGVGLEALSRMNPLLKGPIEYAMGHSAFQRGPGGEPRSLEDQDPLVGRLLRNISDTATGQRTREPVTWPGSQGMESIIGNSPLSRLLSTIRTLTDPRKPLPAKLLNRLTGARLTDVTEASQQAMLQKALKNMMKGEGAKTFENVYFPNSTLATMSPEDQTNARRLQALIQMMAKRKREEAKKRKAAGTQ